MIKYELVELEVQGFPCVNVLWSNYGIYDLFVFLIDFM